jgi:HSP20 family protein
MIGPGFWRLGRVIDLGSEMQRLQRDMNRFFSGFNQPYGNEFPAINVWVGEQDAMVVAEIPGMDSRQIDISIVGDILTLNGVRVKEVLKEGESYHRQERNEGNFTRTLQMPFQVDAANAEAKYEKGILRVKLPRAVEDRPKKINIKPE